jgi:hypothetical protein
VLCVPEEWLKVGVVSITKAMEIAVEKSGLRNSGNRFIFMSKLHATAAFISTVYQDTLVRSPNTQLYGT